jgi:hypothetical protein
LAPGATPALGATPTLPGSAILGPWQLVGPWPLEGTIKGLAAGIGGYAVLHGVRTIEFSPDGTAWQTVELPYDVTTSSNGQRLDAHGNAVYSNGSTFIVVGAYSHEPCDRPEGDGGPPPCHVSPIAWTSDDGLRWTASVGETIPKQSSGAPIEGELAGVWHDGDAWIAALELRESPLSVGNGLLRSVDGQTWTALPAPPRATGRPATELPNAHGGVMVDQGESFVWQVWDLMGDPFSTLARSQPGGGWANVSGFEAPHAVIRLGLPPAPGSEVTLLAGSTREGDLDVPTFWTIGTDSTFVATLPATGTEPPPYVTAADRIDAAFVAVGLEPTGGGLAGVTWTSVDGVAWVRLTEPAFAGIDLTNLFVASGPQGTLAVGEGAQGGAVIWVDG